LESLLHDFSYEELSGKEATYLKKSFESFKSDLENLLNGQSKHLLRENSLANKVTITSGNSSLPKTQKSPMNGLQILVFEDNYLSQRLIDLQLSQCNCTVFVTDSPTDGLEILRDNQIDVVLMDLRMPLMNGFEVSQIIRNSGNERIAKIPIIALSADISLLDEKECHNIGINDFILKPYKLEELTSKIAAHTRPESNTGFIKVNKDKQLNSNKLADIGPLFNECDGDLELLQELVKLFKLNSEEFIDRAQLAIEASDIEKLKFAAHKIKNGLAMVAAKGLQESVSQIYIGCNPNHDLVALKALCSQYNKTYPLVEKELDSQINQLKNR